MHKNENKSAGSRASRHADEHAQFGPDVIIRVHTRRVRSSKMQTPETSTRVLGAEQSQRLAHTHGLAMTFFVKRYSEKQQSFTDKS